MLLVFNFHTKDYPLALKNMEWQYELDNSSDFHCLLAYEDNTPAAMVGAIEAVARRLYRSVERLYYPPSVKQTWPAGPNWGWQNCARYIAALHKDCWLFLEPDAIPIRKGWLKDIADEHIRGGKPFSGHCVEGMGHLNGVAVYPNVVANYSFQALMTEETAWDYTLWTELRDADVKHHAHTLFQHCWCINPETGKAWNGAGELATFKSAHDVVRLVDLSMAIFHRNKDGTLIDQLRNYYAHPEEAMVPAHTSRQVSVPDSDTNERRAWVGDVADEPTASIEIHATNPVQAPAAKYQGKCEIMIVTYWKDEPWLRYCLRLIRRWTSGFSGVTVVIPKRDRDKFAWMDAKDWGFNLNVQLFGEAPSKGMLHHMAMMASADQLVPKGTDHVLHLDADCMFKETVTPDEYIHGNRPVYVVRSYASLYNPELKVVSDCAQWKEPTEKQLGFPVEMYTMCRHPTAFPIKFYPAYRNHIERAHGGMDFFAYMLSGKNSHPQNRMDFTAMGAFAYAKMREDFEWIDISAGNHLAPKDKQKAYWSHGGVTEAIKQEIEGFLK
jgi:hypothetical protein